ncbi:TMP-1 protein [Giardia duodenalis assemblage B]|uniref:TMP-1 protein n=1 Tax=Giardia duodenalis assemblage B TaxID=1394984 RepID=A0A132NYA4_GIAIN|nr:TMP-1 protein [Giardia intestinalis assemblage B]
MHDTSVIVSTPEFVIEKPRRSIGKHILPIVSLGVAIGGMLSMAAFDYARRKAVRDYPTLVTPNSWYWYLEFPMLALSALVPALQLRCEHMKWRWNTIFNGVDLVKHILVALWPVLLSVRATILLDSLLSLIFCCNLAQTWIVEVHCIKRKKLLRQVYHAVMAYLITLIVPATFISAKAIHKESTMSSSDEIPSIIVLSLAAVMLTVDATVGKVVGPPLVLLLYLLGILGTFTARTMAKFPIYTSLPIPISLVDIIVLSFEVVRLVSVALTALQKSSKTNPYTSLSSSFSSPLSASFTYRL